MDFFDQKGLHVFDPPKSFKLVPYIVLYEGMGDAIALQVGIFGIRAIFLSEHWRRNARPLLASVKARTSLCNETAHLNFVSG